MVKKLVTGLAISVGAGLAIAATNNKGNRNTSWHPVKAGGADSPVTIRVHPALPVERDEEPISMQVSAELAEIKVLIETLDQRNNEILSTVNQRIDELQSHLPRFIDVKVTSRLREVEERLRAEFQDEQSKTLDAFLRTLEMKVLPRLGRVEDAVEVHSAEIGEMRQKMETIAPPYPEYAKTHVTEIHQKAVA
jgi:hypothetical protein